MEFLNHNRLPAEDLLFPARLVTIALTAVLALLLAFWTRARFGPAAALLALFLFTLDPNLSAHGHLVTTDMIVALTSFAACLVFERFLASGGTLRLALSGVMLGLALVSKMSALFLLPAFALLYYGRWHRHREPWLAVARHTLLLAVTAAAVVFFTYAPESVRALRGWADGTATPLHKVVARDNALGYGLRVLGRYLGVPAHRYLVGLGDLAERNRQGHESYLLGSVRPRGVWYYFPFAFLVKTSLGVLLLIALAVPLFSPSLARLSATGRSSQHSTSWSGLMVFTPWRISSSGISLAMGGRELREI